MAIFGPHAHWNITFRWLKFLVVERMVPMKMEPSHGGHQFYEHSFFAVSWGDPDGKWRVLFRLPF